jgi:predicted  nucleic acid-binding Zn-ribbon protein
MATHKETQQEMFLKELKAFEERLNERFIGLENRFDAKIESATQSFKEYTDARFSQLNYRFDGVDSRLDKVETRLDNVEQRLGKVETRLDRVELGLGNVETKLDINTKGLVKFIETRVGEIIDLDRRVVALETKH